MDRLVRATDHEGRTALLYASRAGHDSVVTLLLDAVCCSGSSSSSSSRSVSASTSSTKSSCHKGSLGSERGAADLATRVDADNARICELDADYTKRQVGQVAVVDMPDETGLTPLMGAAR